MKSEFQEGQNRKKRRRGRIGGNLKGMVAISAVVAVLLISLSVQSNTLKQKNAVYAKQQSQLEKQIDTEKEKTKEIQDMEDYMQTDEYVAEVARDKLGLVYGDEILFKPEQ